MPVALREELSDDGHDERQSRDRAAAPRLGGDDRGRLAVLEESLAEDAKWHGVEDGQLCADRTEILDVMTRNPPGRLRGRIEETIQTGPRVLGFTVESVFKYRDRMSWAALESDGAEVMFEGTGDPIDHERQGVLFYLYSHDLAALRDQLLAAGIEAGEIEDGSPGPRQEMHITDPDGYVLMVAQIE